MKKLTYITFFSRNVEIYIAVQCTLTKTLFFLYDNLFNNYHIEQVRNKSCFDVYDLCIEV